jgi:hypothetical protein
MQKCKEHTIEILVHGGVGLVMLSHTSKFSNLQLVSRTATYMFLLSHSYLRHLLKFTYRRVCAWWLQESTCRSVRLIAVSALCSARISAKFSTVFSPR